MIFVLSLVLNVVVTYIKSSEIQSATRAFDSPLVLPVVLTACSMFYIARCLENIVNLNNGKASKIIVEISKCTLGIYLLHPIVLRIMYKTEMFINAFPNWKISLHQTLIVSMIAFIISAIIIGVMRRIPLIKKIV